MSGNYKRVYTEEFKKKIVFLYYSGLSVRNLSNDYCVSINTIYRWISEDFANVDKIRMLEDDRNRTLQSELNQLNIENEALKKALIILAKEHR